MMFKYDMTLKQLEALDKPHEKVNPFLMEQLIKRVEVYSHSKAVRVKSLSELVEFDYTKDINMCLCLGSMNKEFLCNCKMISEIKRLRVHIAIEMLMRRLRRPLSEG